MITTVYNTTDDILSHNDAFDLFKHAFMLGKSTETYDLNEAFYEGVFEITLHKKDIDFESLLAAVSVITNVYSENIISNGRRFGHQVFPRMLFCWFAYIYINKTTEDIASFLGYKNHSSVMHSFHTINDSLSVKDNKTVFYIDMIKRYLTVKGFRFVICDQYRVSPLKAEMGKKLEVVS